MCACLRILSHTSVSITERIQQNWERNVEGLQADQKY